MAPKYRISTKGKRLQKRKMKLFSLAVKARRLSVKRPCAITISTEGHSQAEIEYLQDAEAKGLITNVTWIRSNNKGVDDSIRYAIHCLHTKEAQTYNCNIQKQYDYAWIKMALDHGSVPSRFGILQHRSTPTFVRYIQSLGFTDIAGSKTLNKELSKAFWDSLNSTITFPKSYVNILERKRRNRIAMKFLEILNEI